MNLDKLNKGFVYTNDKVDTYRIMSGPPYIGDCDDYAITVLDIYTNSKLDFWFKLVTFQAIIWYCLTENRKEPHAVLWLRGHGYVDNLTKKWKDKTPHKKIFPILWPIVFIKMLLGKVFR